MPLIEAKSLNGEDTASWSIDFDKLQFVLRAFLNLCRDTATEPLTITGLIDVQWALVGGKQGAPNGRSWWRAAVEGASRVGPTPTRLYGPGYHLPSGPSWRGRV